MTEAINEEVRLRGASGSLPESAEKALVQLSSFVNIVRRDSAEKCALRIAMPQGLGTGGLAGKFTGLPNMNWLCSR